MTLYPILKVTTIFIIQNSSAFSLCLSNGCAVTWQIIRCFHIPYLLEIWDNPPLLPARQQPYFLTQHIRSNILDISQPGLTCLLAQSQKKETRLKLAPPTILLLNNAVAFKTWPR